MSIPDKQNMTLDIYVGSQNPAKLRAVELALAQIDFFSDGCHIQGKSVPSGVAAQPKSDAETIQGAINRSQHLHKLYPQGLCIGLEGGVHESAYGMMLCNWGALLDEQGQRYIAGGVRLPLPESVAEGIRQGKELGEMMAEYARKTNVSQQEGAIGVLSQGTLDRSHMFKEVVLLLFGQRKHAAHFYSSSKI